MTQGSDVGTERLIAASRVERDRALAEVERLREAFARAGLAPPRRENLPVLCRDVARWSAPAPRPQASEAVVAVPEGPAPKAPSLDELRAVERHVEALRGLLRIPPDGLPFHTLFDGPRYEALRGMLREANQLADRLLAQVERSRTNKDLTWHLMVARRTDEIHRKRR